MILFGQSGAGKSLFVIKLVQEIYKDIKFKTIIIENDDNLSRSDLVRELYTKENIYFNLQNDCKGRLKKITAKNRKNQEER